MLELTWNYGIWNSPNSLKNISLSLSAFKRHLKTFFLFLLSQGVRLRRFTKMCSISSLLLCYYYYYYYYHAVVVLESGCWTWE